MEGDPYSVNHPTWKDGCEPGTEEAVGLGREKRVSPLEGVAVELCVEEWVEFGWQWWVEEAIADKQKSSVRYC